VKVDSLQNQFSFFLNPCWVFQSKQADHFISLMTPSDRKTFQFNVHSLNHTSFVTMFSYGIRRYVLKEDCLNPFGEYKQLLEKNP
jgi:hypothetical protein